MGTWLLYIYIYSMANMWSVCIIITVWRDVLLAVRPFLTAFAAWSQIKQEHSNQVWFPLFMTLLLRPPTGVMGIFRAVRGCYTLGYEWKLGTQDFMFLYIHCCCFKRSFVGRLTFYFPSFPIVLLHNVLKYRREIKRKRYAILKLDYFLLY